MNAYKFTLSSGKVVYLREPKISDSELAAQVAGKIAGSDNRAHLGVLVQKEMVKLLLLKINEKDLDMTSKENLDLLFSFKEYSELMKALTMIVGEESDIPLVMEFTHFGAQ